MKYFLLITFLIFAPAAHAAEAYTNTKINLRAGPDGGYPIVDILKRNERVELLGCLKGYQWCEVETRSGERGFVYAQYLTTGYRGQSVTIIQNGDNLRIITFRPNYYWDSYYRNKYFYRDRYQWIPRDSGNHNDHHNYNHPRDKDDHHGHNNNNGGGAVKPVVRPAPIKGSDYRPTEAMPTPGRKTYNPLCPMGQNDC